MRNKNVRTFYNFFVLDVKFQVQQLLRIQNYRITLNSSPNTHNYN